MQEEPDYPEVAANHVVGNLAITLPQMRCCQLWIENEGNYSRVSRIYKDKYNVEVSPEKMKTWFGYPQVKSYLEQLMEDKKIAVGETKDKWIADAVRFREGQKLGNAFTPSMHKMIGQAMGYLGGDGPRIDINQEIRVVQGDGTE